MVVIKKYISTFKFIIINSHVQGFIINVID
jgi:hypothetical protein